MSEEEIISKIRYRIYKNYPFYSDLSFNKKHIFSNITDTMSVALTEKNEIMILINKDFIKQNTFEENMFCYLHELTHIALNHLFVSKKYSDKDAYLMNIAQDILTNEFVREQISPSQKLKNSLIFKEKFKEFENTDVKKLSHIEIYEILARKYKNIMQKIQIPTPSFSSSSNSQNQQDNKQQNNQQQDNQSSNSKDILEKIAKDYNEKMNEFKKELDKLSNEITDTEKNIFMKAYKDFYFNKMFSETSEEEKRELEEKIKNEVMNGYTQAKQRGQKFAGMENMIEHVFKKVRDWRRILREEISEIIKGDWTYRKISDTLQSLHIAGFKQIGNLPSLDDIYSLPHIFVGIDTSASISDEEYKDFLNEIYSLLKTVGIKEYEIVMWESEITKIIKSRNGQGIHETLEELKKRSRYGGTRMRSFLNYCNTKLTNNKIAIILTDGEIENDLTAKDFQKFKKVIVVISKEGTDRYIPKAEKIKVIKMKIIAEVI